MRWSVRCVSSTVGSSRRTIGISTDAGAGVRSTMLLLGLDLRLPHRRRAEAQPHRRRRDALGPTAGRWESRPRTGRSSGLKVSAMRPTFAAAGFAGSPRKLARRCAAACYAGRLRQASFSLMRADLPRRLAQVVQLGPAHVAAALDLDAGDQRAVGLEGALDALAAGDLAHGEAAVEAAVALGDHHAFVSLHALARAFDDVDADDDGVAGGELGNRLAETGDFFLLEGLDQVHGVAPGDRARAAQRVWGRRFGPAGQRIGKAENYSFGALARAAPPGRRR